MIVNYNKAKIYMIVPNCEYEEGDVYYGSTCEDYLSKRFVCHRSSYKQWKNGKNKFITAFSLFEKYGLDNCSIVLVENYPCESVDELRSRESYYIRNNKCVNKCIPDRSMKEWYENNKCRIKEHRKIYLENNRDYIKEYKKIYRKNNNDHIKEYQQQWISNNKEYFKDYYKNNKNHIKEYRKQRDSIKYICFCGSSYCWCNKARHYKTMKHQSHPLSIIIKTLDDQCNEMHKLIKEYEKKNI